MLTSKELRDAGYQCNNLLRDQRCAFEWIKRFIGGFGGDPENVSAVGESAGAMALTLHLMSEQKLFSRALATGGNFLLKGPQTEEQQEGTYQRACKALGLDQVSKDERIKGLLKVDMGEAIEKISKCTLSLLPVVHEERESEHRNICGIRTRRTPSTHIAALALTLTPTHAPTHSPTHAFTHASTLAPTLANRLPGMAISFDPMVDSDLIPTSSTYASVSDPSDTALRSKSWLESFIIGDCQFDASVLFYLLGHLKNNCLEAFPKSCRNTLSSHPSVSEKILELYGFDQAVDDEAAFQSVLKIINDVGYTGATLAFAKGMSGAGVKTNLFFFNEPNPWEGAFQGKASHVLDVVFLFQNLNDKLGKGQRLAAEKMAEDVCRWMYGEEPWQEYKHEKGEERAMVYGPSDGNEAVRDVVDVKSKETGRRVELLDVVERLGEGGWDLMSKVVGDFMSGKGSV